MSSNERTTNVVRKEKYDDRGWTIGVDNIKKGGKFDTSYNIDYSSNQDIPKLPLSEEECNTFALLLSKMCLEDKDPDLCKLYFEVQRRAWFGNHYYNALEGMKDVEEKIADIFFNPEQYEKSNTGKSK